NTLRPVSAESLRACSIVERHLVRTYWQWAICLAAVIVPFSFLSFVTSGISDAVRADVKTANELAVKLTSQVETPQAQAQSSQTQTPPVPAGLTVADVLTEVQQFTSLIRAIDGRAVRLNRLVLFRERDPFDGIRQDYTKVHEKFQVPTDLT